MKKSFWSIIVLLLLAWPLGAVEIKTQPSSASSTIGGAVNNLYSITLSDDSTYTLPTITNSAFGIMVIGNDAERVEFSATSAGTINVIWKTSGVAVNADSDTYFCVGTSVANPIILKNRLGATRAVLLNYWYH